MAARTATQKAEDKLFATTLASDILEGMRADVLTTIGREFYGVNRGEVTREKVASIMQDVLADRIAIEVR